MQRDKYLKPERNPRACETCRIRKTRCTGGQPCAYCRTTGIEQECKVRLKARRPRSLKNREVHDDNVPPRMDKASLSPLIGGGAPTRLAARQEPSSTAGSLAASSSRGESSRLASVPCVRLINEMMTDWCHGAGVSPHGLSYKDHEMFGAHSVVPVDPTTEARLMAFYVQSPERHFDVTDRQMLRTLHERYTAMPHSLSPEQLALIYACLCRSSQLHGEAMVGIGAHYYTMARSKLQEWGRASLMSIGAGLLLGYYAMWRAGRDETLAMMKFVADQVRSMGFLESRTASLYMPSDQIGRLLTATIYLDTIVAAHCDEPPHILCAELDWDPTHVALVGEWPLRVMQIESAFSQQLKTRDMKDEIELVLSNETQWLETSRTLTQSIVRPTGQCLEPPAAGLVLGYSAVRLWWLLMMLRIPLLDHPILGGSSWTVAVRAAIRIIQQYAEHHGTGNLQPCWISALRLTTCCQLVMVATAKGYLHSSEAHDLVTTYITLMRNHEGSWPDALLLANSFAGALDTLMGRVSWPGVKTGMDATPNPGRELQSGRVDNPLDTQFDIDWQSILAEQSSDVLSSLFNAASGPDLLSLDLSDTFLTGDLPRDSQDVLESAILE